MDSFAIKLIAVVTMLIDHAGFYFFPHQILFRIIGRLSYPLFAWLIANGAVHTKNIKRYLVRVFVFGCVAQVPYILASRKVEPDYWSLNVLFLFSLALLTIIVVARSTNKVWQAGCICLAITSAILLKVDYGVMGLLSVLAFYYFYHKRKLLIISQILILFILPLISFLLGKIVHQSLGVWYVDSLIEPFAILALIIIDEYNGKRGKKGGYFFYWFYPIQYLLFFVLKLLIP